MQYGTLVSPIISACKKSQACSQATSKCLSGFEFVRSLCKLKCKRFTTGEKLLEHCKNYFLPFLRQNIRHLRVNEERNNRNVDIQQTATCYRRKNVDSVNNVCSQVTGRYRGTKSKFISCLHLQWNDVYRL